MAAPTNIEAMPVVRDLKDFDLKSGNRLERLIFNNRNAVMLACLVITIVLGFMAALTVLRLEAVVTPLYDMVRGFLNYLPAVVGAVN